MGKLSARNKGFKRTVKIGDVGTDVVGEVGDLDGRIEMIQPLIPLGLQAVAEELERAVVELAGPRYQRKASDQPHRRWGAQRGSVYLGDQKLPVEVPRVRNVDSDTEIPLSAYHALQTPQNMDEGLLRRLLKGIATRNYETCAETVPETFGLSSSTVSRRYVKATARKLAQFQERSLADYDLVALFLDGKSFADEQIIIALGVTLNGQKLPLGFVQAASENERGCRAFLAELVDRGLQYDAGLLVVIDGAKGLYIELAHRHGKVCYGGIGSLNLIQSGILENTGFFHPRPIYQLALRQYNAGADTMTLYQSETLVRMDYLKETLCEIGNRRRVAQKAADLPDPNFPPEHPIGLDWHSRLTGGHGLGLGAGDGAL